MVERIAWRTGGFLGTTAQRTLGALAGRIPGPQPPPRRSRLLRGLPTVAGAALGLAVGAATSGNRAAPGTARNTSAATRTTTTARRAAGEARHRTVDLTDKTREELYELARKAGIQGRSGMSKKELTRALSR